MATKEVMGFKINGKLLTEIDGKVLVQIRHGDTIYNLKTITAHTITYVANGSTYATSKVNDGKKPTAKNFPTNPTRIDWIFQGWYINENTRFSVATVVNEDMTVTAKWSQITQTGTEIRQCEDCSGTGQLEIMCPVCDGTGIIANACNNCGIDLGRDWSIDETPNCPKCNAILSTPNAVNPNVECYGGCNGTGNSYEDCVCDNGRKEYPIYETVEELY